MVPRGHSRNRGCVLCVKSHINKTAGSQTACPLQIEIRAYKQTIYTCRCNWKQVTRSSVAIHFSKVKFSRKSTSYLHNVSSLFLRDPSLQIHRITYYLFSPSLPLPPSPSLCIHFILSTKFANCRVCTNLYTRSRAHIGTS